MTAISDRTDKIAVDFDNAIVELRKADKYYISFRILNRYGFYFQGLNCLLFSLETFFKLVYILNKEKYSDKELIRLGHNLKKAFKMSELDKEKFNFLFKTISIYQYTEIRYDSPDLINELNGVDENGAFIILDKLNYEINNLHKFISEKIRKKFNNQFNMPEIMKYGRLEPEEKKNLIDECLSKGDHNFRFDRC